MRILQVSPADIAGGAEGVALRLAGEFRGRGHESWLAVGRREGSGEPDVAELEVAQSTWLDLKRRVEWRLGLESLSHPGSRRCLDLFPQRPQVLHCHNLHGAYFDLRALVFLSAQVPTWLTLHDPWLLAGHCAHPLGCERWRSGCGGCPDLTIYPAVSRDATRLNLWRKRRVIARSRLHIAVPCDWLRARLRDSVHAQSLPDVRVIPYGVNLATFQPRARDEARALLSIEPRVTLVLFVANQAARSPFKDLRTLRAAVARLAALLPERQIEARVLGQDAAEESLAGARFKALPFEASPARVALHYQAADVYAHSSRAETFPLAILEALACGVPVVASDVGGVSEQLKTGAGAADPTGMLVPAGDAEGMAQSIARILRDDSLAARMRAAALAAARSRFASETEATCYLEWYDEVLGETLRRRSSGKD